MVASLRGGGERLGLLWPALGGATTYALLAALAGLGLWGLWRSAGAAPNALALVAPIPLVGVVGSAVTRWYAINDGPPRYFVWQVALAALAVALAGDALLARWPAGRARLAVGAALLALAGAEAALNPRGDGEGLTTVSAWQHKLAWVRSLGCDGVVSDYWESYPYFTLSEGAIRATPVDQPNVTVRSRALAAETLRVPTLCFIEPGGEAPCPAPLVEFGVTRALRDEVREPFHSGLGPRLCRYAPLAPEGGAEGARE